MVYVLSRKDNLIRVMSHEEDDPTKFKAEFTFSAKDLPRVKEILCKGGTIDTYKYTLKFDKGFLAVKYTWNNALYKKIRIDNLDNLITVLSNATKASSFKLWLKGWLGSKEAPMT